MNCKDFFEGAVPATLRKYPSPDSSSLIEAVRERAKNMENNNTVDKSSHSGLIEITPEYAEPKKSTKIVHAVAGIAGAAAVLTGAVFGLKWLNENGGLKERIPESTPGAAYSQNAATTTAAEPPDFTTIFQAYNSSGENRSGYVELDQRYGVGDDLTVHLKGYSFDGLWANIYYDLIFKDEIMGGEFRQRVLPNDTEYGHVETVEYEIEKNIASAIAHYRLNDNEPAESVEVTFGYEDDQPSELFGLTMFKSTDEIQTPAVTTDVYMTTPDNGDAPVMTEETTVTTDVLVTSEYATEDAAEMHDDTTYPIPQVQITDGMIDHTDVTLALGEGNVKILPGRIYDGRILKLKLTGDIDDDTRLGIRSVTNPRTILQGMRKNDDGTYTLSALIDVPDGETDSFELLDIGAMKTEGKPKAIEVINISGNKGYIPLWDSVGVDMTQFGLPDIKLDEMILSSFGLELRFSSENEWTNSLDWNVDIISLLGQKVHIKERYLTVYDKENGLYHYKALIIPEEGSSDLTEMKEISVNGMRVKVAELVRENPADSVDFDNLQPLETAVQVNIPEE